MDSEPVVEGALLLPPIIVPDSVEPAVDVAYPPSTFGLLLSGTPRTGGADAAVLEDPALDNGLRPLAEARV